MSVKSAQSLTVEFTTSSPDTGAAVNADALPTAGLYVNGTTNGAAVTVTNITTGVYKAAVTLPSLAAGDTVGIRVSATVLLVTATAIVFTDMADTALPSDVLTAVDNIHATDLPAIAAQTANLPAVPASKADVDAAKASADEAARPGDTMVPSVVTPATDLSATNAALAALLNDSAVGDVLLTQASQDDAGDVIGKTTPGASVTAYLLSDTSRAVPKRKSIAETDGDWSLYMPLGAEWTVVFAADGFLETTRQVTS